MAKKKNYLSNEELREEILKCITDGFEKAVKNGFDPTLPIYLTGSESEPEDLNDKTLKIGYLFDSNDEEMKEKYNLALKNRYVPERSCRTLVIFSDHPYPIRSFRHITILQSKVIFFFHFFIITVKEITNLKGLVI